MKEGIFSDNENSLINQGLFSINEIDSIFLETEKVMDNKGYKISKDDFEYISLNLLRKNKLNKEQVKTIFDFTNSAYFYSGGLGNSSIVAFSNYFLKSPIKSFLNDKKFGTNLFYDPIFFLNLLKSLKIINSYSDVTSLSIEDLHKLRNNTNFKNFLKEYKRLSLICYININNNQINNKAIELSVLKVLKQDIRLLKYVRRGIFEGTKNFLIWSTLSHPYNLLMMLPLFLFLGDYEKKVAQKMHIDKILFKVTGSIVPLGTFCEYIENAVEKNTF